MKSLAIVGAGIGGCSAAYLARKYLPDVKLTIFDAQDKVGGRILTQKIDGVNLEIGASFFNIISKTILAIVKSEQLELKRIEEQLNFAVWNGSEFTFRSNKNSAVTSLELLFHHKLSFTRIYHLLNEAKRRVARLYLEKTKPADEINALFELARLNEWYGKPFDELLIEKGANRTFIDQMVTPITRTIYSQNADLGGFAGISSLIGVYDRPIYRLAAGNSILPGQLVVSSNSAIKLRQKVTSIEKTREGVYRVYAEGDVTLFDEVIIATPLEIASVELDGIPKPNWEPQRYQKVYTKVMKGIFKPSFFGLNESSEPPTIIMTTKEADPIMHINIRKTQKNESLVTISSTEQLTDAHFHGIFKDDGVPILQHCWTAAYPKFKPIEKLPPTVLDEQLIYLNSIEAAISSM